VLPVSLRRARAHGVQLPIDLYDQLVYTIGSIKYRRHMIQQIIETLEAQRLEETQEVERSERDAGVCISDWQELYNLREASQVA
jgi:hypothetical protein